MKIYIAIFYQMPFFFCKAMNVFEIILVSKIPPADTIEYYIFHTRY